MTTTNKKDRSELTDKPAPFLPGLYSLQCMARKDAHGAPDITRYGKTTKSVLSWKNDMVAKGLFSGFLLRHALDAWDVYNSEGRLDYLCKDAVGSHVVESRNFHKVDRGLMDEEVERVLGPGLTRLGCAEGHAGASAADHSNFVVLNRVLVMEASAEDMHHVYTVDSHQWGCRVLGLYARVSHMSTDSQDKILDRHKWLKNSWPLSNPHHLVILGERLSVARRDYLSDSVAAAIYDREKSNEKFLMVKIHLSTVSHAKRLQVADWMVNTFSDSIIFREGGTEELFDEEILRGSSDKIKEFCRRIIPV